METWSSLSSIEVPPALTEDTIQYNKREHVCLGFYMFLFDTVVFQSSFLFINSHKDFYYNYTITVTFHFQKAH